MIEEEKQKTNHNNKKHIQTNDRIFILIDETNFKKSIKTNLNKINHKF